MRIGSFFLVLLLALVALGYFVSDSFHLRGDMKDLQAEINSLSLAIQQAEQAKQQALTALQSVEQEKQNALTSLQIASQDLQSCQQQVQQKDQLITQTSNENTILKEKNRLLETSVQPINSAQPSSRSSIRPVQSAAIGSIAVIVFSVASVATFMLKKMEQKDVGKGHYVYLSTEEINEVVKRRRNTLKPSC